MVQNIFIARHGARQDSLDPTWRATAEWPDDTPLAENGHRQARQLGLHLVSEDIRHIFSSPFLRAVETASHAADALGLKVKLETGLGEWYSSSFFASPPQIQPLAEKITRFKQVDPAYQAMIKPVYPETLLEMNLRVKKAVQHILANYNGNMLFIGHGASVAAAAMSLAGQDLVINTAICSLTQVQKKGRDWSLVLNGDTSHLT